MELNDNELWYVKAAIRRGIAGVEEIIEKADEYLAMDEDEVPAWARSATENMRAYHAQMLSEMKQYIPKELQS